MFCHEIAFLRRLSTNQTVGNENGKIKLFREALNTLELAKANVQNSADLF